MENSTGEHGIGKELWGGGGAAVVLLCARVCKRRHRQGKEPWEGWNNPCGSHRAGNEVCVLTSRVGRPPDLEGMGGVTP